ncbi:MAG: NAD(P)/FAD-dependent oxidoreductase [Burkholderiales bacterium]|nr:NAD(P)/FAD-dependent oxidoreductase [Burkholderiales bacterium]
MSKGATFAAIRLAGYIPGMQSFDVIVIGAGAAGLFCAALAGQRGRRVLLLDHAEAIGEKIRISGGGRCNFTNTGAGPGNYVSANPHFCRSALSRYTAADFVAQVRRHGIAFHEKTLGQLFCDDSAQQIIQMLLDECADGAVTLRHPVSVSDVSHHAGRFCVRTQPRADAVSSLVTGPHMRYDAAALVVATGGLSIPATGATGLGYELARQFGVPVTALAPGLVPLALDAPDLARYGGLSGVSVDTIARCDDAPVVFREATLLTHRGLSGPAVLQLSNYWRAGQQVRFDLLPDVDAAVWLDSLRARKPAVASFARALAEHLPTRLADAWASAQAPDAGQKPIAHWTRAELRAVAAALKGWSFRPSGTLGYKKAEVTLGGVDTRALSQQTMAARAVPGLHFIGEVVDVTGWLGGYNFQWAWSSAFACAQAL